MHLSSRDEAIAIFIEDFEGLPQLFLRVRVLYSRQLCEAC